jgi:hypothetical protein
MVSSQLPLHDSSADLLIGTAEHRVQYLSGNRASKNREGVDWLLFVTLIIMILLSGAVQYMNIYALAAINAFLQLALLYRIKFKISNKCNVALIFFSIYLFYSISIQSFYSEIYFVAFRFHDILTALLITNYFVVYRPNFNATFKAVLLFFIVHGFVNWLVVTFAFDLFTPSDSVKAYRFMTFFGMEEKYLGIYRSQSMFWEPGVYQLYLNIALHYFLFYTKQRFWVVMSLVGLVLTLSTTGIVIASIQLIYSIFWKNLLTRRKIIYLILFMPLIASYYNLSTVVIEDKLTGASSGSFLARSFDFQNGLAVAVENPFGIGFDPYTYQDIAAINPFNIETPLDTNRGQTNGILILIISTGWFWGLIFLYFTYRQRIFPQHKILFFIVLIFSLFSEPLFFSPFILLFTVSGMIHYKPLS